jgi:uncharacterized protein YbjQ (UPF0145 family)
MRRWGRAAAGGDLDGRAAQRGQRQFTVGQHDAHALRGQRAHHQRVHRAVEHEAPAGAVALQRLAGAGGVRQAVALAVEALFHQARARREAVAVHHRGAQHRMLERDAQLGLRRVQRQAHQLGAAAVLAQDRFAGGGGSRPCGEKAARRRTSGGAPRARHLTMPFSLK